MSRCAVYDLNENKYELSQFMLESCLIKNYFDLYPDETVINLTMFEDEFQTLNSGNYSDSIDSIKQGCVSIINHAYCVLGYFGIDSLIKELDEHVYFLEMTKIPKNNKKYFRNARKIQISSNTKLSESFFEKHMDWVIWEYLCKNTSMSEAFFERHIPEGKLDWRSLSANTSMSEAFFERHIPEGKVDWYYITRNTNISEVFFQKYHTFAFEMYCDLYQRQDISEAFFERNINYHKLSWSSLCSNNNLSEEFFERRLQDSSDKIQWFSLCLNTNMSEEFFERHIPGGMVNWYGLCRNTNMSEAFFERHLNMVIWSILSVNSNMSEAFFERHLDMVNWHGLSANTNMSEAFFERHLNMIKWENFCYSYGHKLPESFYERNSDKLNWHYISRRNFSEDFFHRHKDETIPCLMYKNNFVSLEFVIKHAHNNYKLKSPILYASSSFSKDKYNYNQWLNLV